MEIATTVAGDVAMSKLEEYLKLPTIKDGKIPMIEMAAFPGGAGVSPKDGKIIYVNPTDVNQYLNKKTFEASIGFKIIKTKKDLDNLHRTYSKPVYPREEYLQRKGTGRPGVYLIEDSIRRVEAQSWGRTFKGPRGAWLNKLHMHADASAIEDGQLVLLVLRHYPGGDPEIREIGRPYTELDVFYHGWKDEEPRDKKLRDKYNLPPAPESQSSYIVKTYTGAQIPSKYSKAVKFMLDKMLQRYATRKGDKFFMR
jgi:hypothetical protein